MNLLIKYWLIAIPSLMLGLCLRAHASQDVAPIMPLQAGLSFEQRHKSLHALSSQQISAAVDELLAFLINSEKPEKLHPIEYLSLKNDAFDLLAAQNSQYSDQLLSIALVAIEDVTANTIWRDYCVQKLALLLNDEVVDGELSNHAFDVLEKLASGRISGFQGTALIVSVQLESVGDTWITTESIGGYALACLNSEHSELTDRVTALQVLAKCGDVRALEYSRQFLLASDSNPAPMMIVSSIATVGQLGESSDISILTPFRQAADLRFRTSARVAIDHLSK